MSRVNDVIEKYGLRDTVTVRGVTGQKMSEECIQQFIASDPSGTCKYLDWMLLQAGGGLSSLERSRAQWESGDHDDPPLRESLKGWYIKDCVAGFADESGVQVGPMSAEEAERRWEEKDQEIFRKYHIYGDEDYVLTGFGFFRQWPGGSTGRYDTITSAVNRFHRYRPLLKSCGKSTDLSAKNYPTIDSLLVVLAEFTVNEVMSALDHDTVYEDNNVTIIAPYTIGSSIRYGHHKWCTSNESMFKSAVATNGPNRWEEYASGAALYYCRLYVDGKLSQIAIRVELDEKDTRYGDYVFYDTTDAVVKPDEITAVLSKSGHGLCSSWSYALEAVKAHVANYPSKRLNLRFDTKLAPRN